MKNTILAGNIMDRIDDIPDQHVSCIITSPPYWSLRVYTDEDKPIPPSIWDEDTDCEHEFVKIKTTVRTKMNTQGNTETRIHKKAVTNKSEYTMKCSKCNAWKGQLGQEPDPILYVKHLVQVFRKIKRILRDDGTLWVNIGDTYSGSGGAGGDWDKGKRADQPKWRQPKIDFKRKGMLLIPERFVIAMQEDGWIVRNVISWNKPAPMTESMDDRSSRDFEPIYFFVKKPNYAYNQRFEPMSLSSIRRLSQDIKNQDGSYRVNAGAKINGPMKAVGNPLLGRNKKTTWVVNTVSYKGAHFAVMPKKIAEEAILAGSPRYICATCDRPYIQIHDEYNVDTGNDLSKHRQTIIRSNLRYAPNCICEGEKRRSIVFDPFMGTGTVAYVARQYDRDWLGVEISDEYIGLIKERLLGKETPDGKVRQNVRNSF